MSGGAVAPAESDSLLREKAYDLYCEGRVGNKSSIGLLQDLAGSSEHRPPRLSPEDWAVVCGYLAYSLFKTNEKKAINQKKSLDIFRRIFPLLSRAEEEEDEKCRHVYFLLGVAHDECVAKDDDEHRDVAEAAKYFLLSSELNLPAGQCNAGWCYYAGQGVGKDMTKAARYFKLSAEQGYAYGQFNLGWCCCEGEGTPRDLFKGIELYTSSALKGLAQAQYNLGLCFQNGTGVASDLGEAQAMFKRAADQGLSHAQCNLGFYLRHSVAGERDVEESFRLICLAADAGSAFAMHELYMMYDKGENDINLRPDVVQAMRFLKKAIEGGVGSEEEVRLLETRYKEALWESRRSFLLFLVQFQFIYRASQGSNKDELLRSLQTQRDPDVIHTVFYTEDMRREIMGFI